jgi:DNA gyrase/topoisomerase IV subunit B
MIRNKLMVFVNCLVENPHFDSQSKDNLTSVQSVTLEDCKLSPKFLKEIIHRLDLVEEILADISMREKRKLMKAVTSKATRNSVSNNINRITTSIVTFIVIDFVLVIIITIIYVSNSVLTSQLS